MFFNTGDCCSSGISVPDYIKNYADFIINGAASNRDRRPIFDFGQEQISLMADGKPPARNSYHSFAAKPLRNEVNMERLAKIYRENEKFPADF